MDRTLHVFSTGEFQRRGNTLYFREKNGQSRYLPIENVGAIYLHSDVTFNKRFLEFLAEHEIILHYFNHYGFYTGSFYPREHYNSGFMTVKQVEAYIDPNLRRFLAWKFIKGGSNNMLKVLEYYGNRGKSLEEVMDRIRTLQVSLSEMLTIQQLMAIEGNIREQYYLAFDTIVDSSDFRFEGRSHRPPANEMNSLISFGNSLIYTAILSEIYKTHLDPRIGYLHTSNHRRFSLNLDVAELFKPVIVDRLIFSLINKRQISLRQFQHIEGGITMTEDARKTFVKEFDERLRTIIYHRKSRRKVSYRRLIRFELYKIEKHLLGEAPYEPFLALW